MIHKIGKNTLLWLQAWGYSALLLARAVIVIPTSGQPFKLLIRYIYFFSSRSAVLILVSGIVLGMISTFQINNILTEYGADRTVRWVVALTLFQQYAPLITGLLFTSYIASSVASEMAIMKATEQISSIEIMGINANRYIIWPRFWAIVITLPLLFLLFNLAGSLVIAGDWSGKYAGSIFENMYLVFHFYDDIVMGLIRSLLFSIVISWVAVYQGFTCPSHITGISAAVQRSIIYSTLSILVLNFILTVIGD